MNGIEQFGKVFIKEWKRYVQREQLTDKQAQQFERYLILLRTESNKINLTTITDPFAIVAHHFCDSIQIRQYVDLRTMQVVCDIGTGAGFPGIPLKILFPHLKLILIEVNNKKIRFLRQVIRELDLQSCEIYSSDWRTFLRNTTYAVDLFCARASLKPKELLRLFKPSCPYKHAILVYWAAQLWHANKQEQLFVQSEHEYQIENKQRKLVFFRLQGKKS